MLALETLMTPLSDSKGAAKLLEDFIDKYKIVIKNAKNFIFSFA